MPLSARNQTRFTWVSVTNITTVMKFLFPALLLLLGGALANPTSYVGVPTVLANPAYAPHYGVQAPLHGAYGLGYGLYGPSYQAVHPYAAAALAPVPSVVSKNYASNYQHGYQAGAYSSLYGGGLVPVQAVKSDYVDSKTQAASSYSSHQATGLPVASPYGLHGQYLAAPVASSLHGPTYGAGLVYAAPKAVAAPLVYAAPKAVAAPLAYASPVAPHYAAPYGVGSYLPVSVYGPRVGVYGVAPAKVSYYSKGGLYAATAPVAVPTVEGLAHQHLGAHYSPAKTYVQQVPYAPGVGVYGYEYSTVH